MPLWRYAKDYTLMDHFHHAAFGGSFLNHLFLICACAPRYPDAPAPLVAQLDDHGRLITDGAVTPDGYAVNTLFPSTAPIRRARRRRCGCRCRPRRPSATG